MRFIDLKRIGYLFGNLPIPVYKAIDEEIQEMIDNNFEKCSPFNNNLAGAIEKEFLLHKSHFIVEEFITEACKTLIPALGWNDAVGKELELTRLWVNFQKKNEYNPIHQHGGHVSFVFWHKVPYNAEDERQVGNRITSNLDTPGSFSFNYPNHNEKGGITFPLIRRMKVATQSFLPIFSILFILSTQATTIEFLFLVTQSTKILIMSLRG